MKAHLQGAEFVGEIQCCKSAGPEGGDEEERKHEVSDPWFRSPWEESLWTTESPNKYIFLYVCVCVLLDSEQVKVTDFYL